MGKVTVVVLFGGRSSEHSISVVTAGGVLNAIDPDRFNVIPVGITREGAFVLEEMTPSRFLAPDNVLPNVLDNGTRVLWPMPGSAEPTLQVRHTNGTVADLGLIDVVLPILHGPYGEDGAIQGFFETLDLTYAGSGVLGSALSMDKHFMKLALQAAGLSVAPGVTVYHQQWLTDPQAVREQAAGLGLPLFVKPARAGSSVGVSRVTDLAELDEACAVAFEHDNHLLMETGISGREIEVAILGGTEGPRASVAGEIVLTGRDFYDFEGKYLQGSGVELRCPAQLTDDDLARVQEVGKRAFLALDGRGLARVDMFLTDSGEVLVNEVNTMPGFTPISMFPQCWIASGMTYSELLSELIDTALAG